MKTIDEIYDIVEESSHETAFNKGEVEGLYEYLHKLNKDSIVVEIGVEYGRSTSVIAEIQKEIGYTFYAVDPFTVQDNGAEAKAHVLAQIEKHGWKYNLLEMTSEQAEEAHKNFKIDFIHIDGDHVYEAVKKDIELWLPKLVKGGYACFDDYGHDSLPGVYKAVAEYMDDPSHKFEFLGRYGNKLGVFRKL